MVITMDVMDCQKKIAKLTEEKKGDYFLSLKGNQREVFVIKQLINLIS